MADESDVEAAIVNAMGAIVYPAGAAAPPAGGYPTRIARGEPNSAALDSDLTAGIVNVHVRLLDLMARNTTRYLNAWQPQQAPEPSLAVSQIGARATFLGTCAVAAVVGVRAAGLAATYATQTSDTPTTVAAAVAALIAGASANGATVTLPAVPGGAVEISAWPLAPSVRETRRQEQGFTITISAPTPDARSAVGALIDAALADTEFLALADGSAGRLRYKYTRVDDVPSKANLWRRTLVYTVEYGTTAALTSAPMVIGTFTIDGAQGGLAGPLPP